jgi:type I restriction enzyme S subunit
MENWIETTIGKFCPFVYGKGLPEKDRNSSGKIPVFGSNGIVGKHSKPLVNEAGIIIGRKGTAGAIHFSPNPFWAIDTTFYISDFPARDLKFTLYLLRTLGLDKMNSDSAVPGLNRENAHSIKIKVPPIEEQKAIAKILSSLDDKIELNRRMNETLEAIARTLFKAWFIDFEPARANMENRSSESASPEIAKLFPSEFENDLPKGWKLGTIGENHKLTMGQSPLGETYNENGEGILFFQGRTDFGFRYPSPRIYCTQPTRFAEKGDTLVSVRAPVGDVNMAFEKSCIGRGVAALRHNSGSRSFTYYSVKNLEEAIRKFDSEGTVFGSINKNSFQAIKTVEPTANIVELFEKTIKSFDSKIEGNSKELVYLTQTRDSLLPRLISGKIKVGAAENKIEAAI